LRRARFVRRGVPVVLLLIGCGVGAWLLLHHDHRVVVVRVQRTVSANAQKPVGQAKEYPAASGAPSLEAVRADLRKVEHGRESSDGAARSSSVHASALLTSVTAASFKRLTAGLGMPVGLAVAPLAGGQTQILGDDEAAHGWSTTKVPVLAALLRARGSHGLSGQELEWARSAITESDNASILSLFHDLEGLEGGLSGASSYVQQLLRDSGDTQTVVATAPPPPGASTTFGQTEWSPSEAVKFFRALSLGCLLSAQQTSYVLGLMQRIVPSESWGLGSAGFAAVAFKGGWGPERGGYLVRQSGIVSPGFAGGAAVAIVTAAPDFAQGTETLSRVAAWLERHLVRATTKRISCPA
jgi:hypothetical protein